MEKRKKIRKGKEKRRKKEEEKSSAFTISKSPSIRDHNSLSNNLKASLTLSSKNDLFFTSKNHLE